MDLTNVPWQTKWLRRLAWTLLLTVIWASLTGNVWADGAAPDGVGAAAAERPNFFWQIVTNLFNSEKLMDVLGQREFMVFAIIALNVIVFTETGLLIGFFLPGDSLLVTAGIVCGEAGWSLPLLLATLCISAIVGDSVGYSIGWKTGPKIFSREQSFLFHKDHLLAAQRFYEVHGGKTIILARFMPIIRTFAPVVAGVGKMEYRRFLFFNVFGGISWVVSMILIGYFLTDLIDPPFKWMFGPEFMIRKHIEKVIIVVVLLSVSPGAVVWLRKKLKGKEAESVPALVAEPAGKP